MQKHILDHLLSLFLMALPERDDLPEASSSKSRSRVNEQSVQSLDVKNLDVGSEDYLDEDYATVVFEAVPNDETQEDWSFLPPYEYGDPDTDSILDHFKPHLQASFVLDPLLEIMPQNDVEIMESEGIIELREAMNAIPDEFGFIHDAVLVWDAHMKTQHQQNELARQKRQHAKQNRIRFFSRKKEFERTEVSRKFEETRSEYETFVKEVFDLVWKKMNFEVDQLTPLYTKAIQLVEEASAGRDMFQSFVNLVSHLPWKHSIYCIKNLQFDIKSFLRLWVNVAGG